MCIRDSSGTLLLENYLLVRNLMQLALLTVSYTHLSSSDCEKNHSFFAQPYNCLLYTSDNREKLLQKNFKRIYDEVETDVYKRQELYRVYDYEEKQSFIQSLINNTNIYIYSGDNSTPELLMNGLKANLSLIHI